MRSFVRYAIVKTIDRLSPLAVAVAVAEAEAEVVGPQILVTKMMFRPPIAVGIYAYSSVSNAP